MRTLRKVRWDGQTDTLMCSHCGAAWKLRGNWLRRWLLQWAANRHIAATSCRKYNDQEDWR